MLPVEVDSTGYVDAVGQLAGANRAVVDAVDSLTDVLYASGAMAGTDTGGEEWARQYDPAAAQLVQAGCSMGDALANMANLLNGSLANHEGAEHAALMYPGMPAAASGDTDPAHGTESLSAPAPPSAAGGTGDQPGWWHWIAGHVGGLLWPDADTGKLRGAGAAWVKAGASITDQQYAVDAADGALYAIVSPEMDDVHGACREISGHLGTLGGACAAVGKACDDYARHVDDKHKEIEDELRSFIEWTIGIEAAGGLLSVVTVGISEAAAQAAEGAEVANAASKVIRILNELIELARTVKTAIETAIKSIGEVVLKLGKFVNAKLVTALEKAGVGVARGERPAALLAELDREGVKFSRDDVMMVFRDSDGRIVFLEKGNANAGFEHILGEHADDFVKAGIPKSEIQSVIKQALTDGNVVGTQGRGRLIYEVTVDGEVRHVAITVGKNGYIVGANPRSVK
ncbi:hypothetical protein P5P86_09010 [Nocardioides sp. BP30]|uniref:WXG100-like domain-containing protein n=1 Tax=Nocardioides sp. BP30 TaxID=3036374 RepID=UPI00246921E2|nr:hypothetical protein [Nocardioides sp. BP30]WGL53950.1 hypothetical protein P5P86_09010 [Nocardioides sp. BP30]